MIAESAAQGKWRGIVTLILENPGKLSPISVGANQHIELVGVGAAGDDGREA